MNSNSGAIWRNVTDDDVLNAVNGSFLETLITAFSKNYRGKSPLPIILIQSLVLMGVALTGWRKEPEQILPDQVPKGHGSEEDKNRLSRVADMLPAQKSRIWIETGYGNVPNVFGLIVAPSGAGKGIGCLRLASHLGYTEYSGGTLEGVMDAAMVNPHILFNLPELGAMLQGKGAAVDKLKKGLTDMFSSGTFTEALASRKGAVSRTVEWFYPSVLASIQPEVLRSVGRSLDIAQGFFSRFLIGYLSEKDMDYEFNPCNGDITADLEKIDFLLGVISALQGSIEVPDTEYNIKFFQPMRPFIDPKMRPVLERYGNEYLPRIALMLTIPADFRSAADIPDLDVEHFIRATVVLHRIFSMAEAALGGLNDLEGRSRLQENNLIKMVQLLNRLRLRGEKATAAVISRNASGTGWDGKTREALLNELVQREWIEIRHPEKGVCEAGQRGAIINLQLQNLPPSVL